MPKKPDFRSMLPYKPAIVIWEDAHTTDEDTIEPSHFDNDEVRQMIYSHCGWVCKDDDFGVVLFYAFRSDGQAEKDISIPREYIKHMEYL